MHSLYFDLMVIFWIKYNSAGASLYLIQNITTRPKYNSCNVLFTIKYSFFDLNLRVQKQTKKDSLVQLSLTLKQAILFKLKSTHCYKAFWTSGNRFLKLPSYLIVIFQIPNSTYRERVCLHEEISPGGGILTLSVFTNQLIWFHFTALMFVNINLLYISVYNCSYW